MSGWIGSIVGALLGFILTKRPQGLLLGAAIGFLFDRGFLRWHNKPGFGHTPAHREFLRTLFSLLGQIAKVDGRVNETEVAMGEKIIAQMKLDADDHAKAIGFFNQGKQNAQTEISIAGFVSACGERSEMAGQLIDALMTMALCDGAVSDEERLLLENTAHACGFDPGEIERRLRARAGHVSNMTDAEAYKIIGASNNTSDDEITRLYRKLMSQYHPDKLQGAGMTGEELRFAQSKAAMIRAAYDHLCLMRGIK
jgi:DnaJ like chaperone protein